MSRRVSLRQTRVKRACRCAAAARFSHLSAYVTRVAAVIARICISRISSGNRRSQRHKADLCFKFAKKKKKRTVSFVSAVKENLYSLSFSFSYLFLHPYNSLCFIYLFISFPFIYRSCLLDRDVPIIFYVIS